MKMAANPIPPDIQSVIEAIAILTAQVMAITVSVQNSATATGNNATASTTTNQATPYQI